MIFRGFESRRHLFRRKRLVKIESLDHVYAKIPQDLDLPFLLHTLRNDVHVDFLGQIHNVRQYCKILRLCMIHKALVDLERVKGYLPKQGKGGTCAAEIINGYLVSKLMQCIHKATEHTDRKLVAALRDLNFDQIFRNPGLRHYGIDMLYKIRIIKVSP